LLTQVTLFLFRHLKLPEKAVSKSCCHPSNRVAERDNGQASQQTNVPLHQQRSKRPRNQKMKSNPGTPKSDFV
jgi:hypothetical protein